MHQHPPSHAVSAESASTVTAPPPVSLWASRIHAQDPPQALDSLRRASASPRLRADSPVLGSERPRIRVMSSALPLEILPRAHWLSRVRSCLRLLIIVLSGAVVFMLMHTLGIYRGNRYLELRKGEIPMVWPAHTNLAPTIILLAVAAANFLASVAILSLSFKRSFRRPIRSRDLYRILAGSLGVVLWAAALAVFHLLDHASKASLRRYSCTNQGRVTNGRFQYRAVCEEQNVAFYTAMGAASAELLTLLTLAASAIRSIRDESPLPTIQIHDKAARPSTTWKPARQKTWIH